MARADRMIARALVAADFDLDQIPKSVWYRAGHGPLGGPNAKDRWKLPIQICSRLLKNHKSEIRVPGDLG